MQITNTKFNFARVLLINCIFNYKCIRTCINLQYKFKYLFLIYKPITLVLLVHKIKYEAKMTRANTRYALKLMQE